MTRRRRRFLSGIGIKYGAEEDGRSTGSEVDASFARGMEEMEGVVEEGGERLFFFLLRTSGNVDLYVGIKFSSRGALRLWSERSMSFFKSFPGKNDWRKFFGG